MVYLYDGWQVVEEREPDGQAWEARRQFIYGGTYIDEPLIFDKDTDSDGDCVDAGGSSRFFYAQQANFNVVAVSASDGTVVETVTYDPYGEATVTVAGGQSASGSPYLFQGRRWDGEADLYYFRNRALSPRLGRFVQRDPIGYVDGLDLYEFVGSSSVAGRDSFGLVNYGEICKYTGRGKPKVNGETTDYALVERFLEPAKAAARSGLKKIAPDLFEEEDLQVTWWILKCLCEVKCCDYDLRLVHRPVSIVHAWGPQRYTVWVPKWVWWPDPRHDYTYWKTVDKLRLHSSFRSMLAESAVVGRGIANIVGNALRDVSEEEPEQLFFHAPDEGSDPEPRDFQYELQGIIFERVGEKVMLHMNKLKLKEKWQNMKVPEGATSRYEKCGGRSTEHE